MNRLTLRMILLISLAVTVFCTIFVLTLKSVTDPNFWINLRERLSKIKRPKFCRERNLATE